ncbi:hypothetical protein FNJ57_01275 [Lactococcus lactis]|nr:hypothetical protein FNJ56_01275 [Lactococcus lactis]TRW69700.1 hypothetical protein FNJ57_01275 [Lactococcus lactis]
MFLLIYLYYEVKGKSTKYHKYRFELLHKLVRVRLPDLLLYFITGCPLGSLLLLERRCYLADDWTLS